MAAEQRKLLEQLMGGGVASRGAQMSLTDPKVCRSYIAGTCPHDLFTNTKQDLGMCPKVHSDALKVEFEGLSPPEKLKYGFEYDYVRDLQKYIDECNRRIEIAQRRLDKTPDEIRQTNALLKQINELNAAIEQSLIEVEVLGEAGLVGLALDELMAVRQTTQARVDKEKELKALSDTSGPSGHQKLQVCDVCGAYLSRLDNDRRLADHFYGKMHLGYAQMRKTYETLSKESRLNRGAPSRPPPVNAGSAMADDRDRGDRGDRGDRDHDGSGTPGSAGDSWGGRQRGPRTSRRRRW
ncbi:u1 snrnp splicing complex subunit [Ophiostoma piceae UAMH 11346]|uniref:U1 snrnp splicing complex subunit n=1 Tax=Ophiostoma piceae (strain UAMH 11346) TaxID=1262450 RepID=S3BPX3_OPHP1|nr:u1 snrnp splicing complex subunit [Ophiostoma piceae UAMH 11346]